MLTRLGQCRRSSAHSAFEALPLEDLSGHARFQGFGVPIGGGDLGLTTRFEYEAMFDIGRIDIAQPDVTMVGGITELMRLSAMVKRRGKRLVTHGYKSNITIAVNLGFLAQHWTESRRNIPPANRLCAGS